MKSAPGEVGGFVRMAMGRIVQLQRMTNVGAHTQDATVSAATTLTAPAGATGLLLQCTGQNIRYTLDGTVPTTSKGFQMTAGDPPLLIPLGANTTVKVIEETATATVEYQFVRDV